MKLRSPLAAVPGAQRGVTVSTLVLLLVALMASPAAAGGAVWQFDRTVYQPGEVATAVTGIGWAHNPELGTPEDGPYRAYVILSARLDEPGAPPYPGIPEEAVPVGEVEIGLDPQRARVRFVVPDLPDGTYNLLHCNVPCTTTLADIIWGQLVIGSPSPTTPSTRSTAPPTTASTTVPVSPSTASTTTTTETPTEKDGGNEPPIALAIGGGAVAAAALMVGALRHRRP